MNADTRRQIIEDAHAREIALIDTKGREYTGGAEQGNELDTLANFKRVAERTGLNALQVWGVYFLKHVDAISTYLQDPTRATSEPITGRIDDARTYLGLLDCLLIELDPVHARNAPSAPPRPMPAPPTSRLCSDVECRAPINADGSANHVAGCYAFEPVRTVSVDARSPRRCCTCGDPTGIGGIQVRTNDRTSNYCGDECARIGEPRV